MGRSHLVPRIQAPPEPEQGHASLPRNWGEFEFFSIDSEHTVKVEDAIHVSPLTTEGPLKEWHLDLRVVHPLPLEDGASLCRGKPSVCLGFGDDLPKSGEGVPTLSLVIATNTHQFIDSELAAIAQRDATEKKECSSRCDASSERDAKIAEKLLLLRASAQRVSHFKDRDLRPEHSVDLIMTHAQRRILRLAREFPDPPPLVVLRPTGSRVLNRHEATKLGFPAGSPCVEVSAGARVPTLVRAADSVERYDTLRMKPNSLSGLINSLQISCALLGIPTIPADLIEGAVPEGSKLDTYKPSSPLPEHLKSALNERKRAIRAVLEECAPRAVLPCITGDRPASG